MSLENWPALTRVRKTRPYRHVRERSFELRYRLRRADSRFFDVVTLDGGYKEEFAGDDDGDNGDEWSGGGGRRHSAAMMHMIVAKRILERRRRASTAPGRIESPPPLCRG